MHLNPEGKPWMSAEEKTATYAAIRILLDAREYCRLPNCHEDDEAYAKLCHAAGYLMTDIALRS